MRRPISFQQYRSIDLLFWSVLLCLCETLIVLGANVWFPYEAYTLSLTPAVTAIILVRWGGFAVIPALLSSLVFCVFFGATAQQYLIYCLGDLLVFTLLPLLKRMGWKRLHDDVLLCMLYGLLSALLMQLGRFIVAWIMGTPPTVCAAFFTTDILSTLFAVLLVWIARRLDGMLEDQEHYLKRIQKEMQQKRGMTP